MDAGNWSPDHDKICGVDKTVVFMLLFFIIVILGFGGVIGYLIWTFPDK